MWLTATVVFEFGFGHYVIGHSWDRLLRDYNLLEGRVWLLFLTATTVIPYIVQVMQAQVTVLNPLLLLQGVKGAPISHVYFHDSPFCIHGHTQD